MSNHTPNEATDIIIYPCLIWVKPCHPLKNSNDKTSCGSIYAVFHIIFLSSSMGCNRCHFILPDMIFIAVLRSYRGYPRHFGWHLPLTRWVIHLNFEINLSKQSMVVRRPPMTKIRTFYMSRVTNYMDDWLCSIVKGVFYTCNFISHC